jgi:hypothetical protein
MEKEKIISRIIEIETILVNSLFEGHKPIGNDKYQPLRIEVRLLRCLYFGEDSPYCKNQIS